MPFAGKKWTPPESYRVRIYFISNFDNEYSETRWMHVTNGILHFLVHVCNLGSNKTQAVQHVDWDWVFRMRPTFIRTSNVLLMNKRTQREPTIIFSISMVSFFSFHQLNRRSKSKMCFFCLFKRFALCFLAAEFLGWSHTHK